MRMENADKNIQHAERQESTAYAAKKQAFHELQESIDHRYGEDILDHYKVRNYALEVSPSYEGTSIRLNLHILPKIKEIRDSGLEEDMTLEHLYKRHIREEIQKMLVDEWELQTDINIRVRTEEQFERLRK